MPNHNINKIIEKNIQKIKYEFGEYIGQVSNGLREGKEFLKYNNGYIYEGDFKNDKQEGKGIYYYKNGKIENLFYLNGKEIK